MAALVCLDLGEEYEDNSTRNSTKIADGSSSFDHSRWGLDKSCTGSKAKIDGGVRAR